MNPFRTLPLVAVVATLVVACSSPGASPSASPIAVDGHTYLSTDVVGQVLVPGTRITLAFKAGNLSASAGCNTMNGAYTIADGRLKAGPMMSTMMGCDALLMRQDTWLSTYLSDVGITQDGDTLHLDDGKVQVTLVDREVADPDRPLEGTLWIVDGVIANEGVSTVPVGIRASLRIVDGRAEVDTGCNTGGGDVTVTPDTLTFGPMLLTKKACEADAADDGKPRSPPSSTATSPTRSRRMRSRSTTGRTDSPCARHPDPDAVAALCGQAVGERAADPFQDRGAEQELPHSFGLADEDFGEQVVRHRSLAAGELGDEPPGVGVTCQRHRGEAEARGPPLCPRQEGGGGLGGELDAGCVKELPRLPGR